MAKDNPPKVRQHQGGLFFSLHSFFYEAMQENGC